MRDENRIPVFCERLAKAWSNLPDWRFGQLMVNLFEDMARDGKDAFYPEDDKMIALIENYSRKMGAYYGTLKK